MAIMTSEDWAEKIPMNPILTGVSVKLKLFIYSDGQGCLSCPDDASFTLPLRNKGAMQAAFRDLWDRGVREGMARNPFVRSE